jgi:glycosyltransferase involved in cell wall biosynthesis
MDDVGMRLLKDGTFLGRAMETDNSLTPISKPYLLVTLQPFHVDSAGDMWLDRLWHKDLIEHLVYIQNLSLLAPKHATLDFSDPVRMSSNEAKRIKFIAIPNANSLGEAVKVLPRTISQSWNAVGEASIVHSSVTGWPIPIGWIVNPIALVRGKTLFIVIESALWQIAAARRRSWKEKLKAQLTERLASYFVNRANLSLFTQEAYRSSLSTKPKGKSIVVPASWIDEADVIALDHSRPGYRPAGPARFFCPSRLTYDKGIVIFLDALRLLESAKIFCEVTIMGSGELKSACDELATQLSAVRLKVPNPANYGETFFKFIRDNDCVVIPIISDEQPRIIFDTYSQGRPVIASDTDGLRQHVNEGQTGWLVRPNDPNMLAQTLKMIVENIENVHQYRTAIRNKAMKLTHQIMHRRRWRALSDLIENREIGER